MKMRSLLLIVCLLFIGACGKQSSGGAFHKNPTIGQSLNPIKTMSRGESNTFQLVCALFNAKAAVVVPGTNAVWDLNKTACNETDNYETTLSSQVQKLSDTNITFFIPVVNVDFIKEMQTDQQGLLKPLCGALKFGNTLNTIQNPDNEDELIQYAVREYPEYYFVYLSYASKTSSQVTSILDMIVIKTGPRAGYVNKIAKQSVCSNDQTKKETFSQIRSDI